MVASLSLKPVKAEDLHVRQLPAVTGRAFVAAMKIVAVSQRGRKRDFVDLYWYCLNREPLGAVIHRASKQYPGQERNLPHIIKSLTYFADAETEPMPRLFFKADWRIIKAYFQREVPKVAKEFLGLK